jgi:hypothetical protein
MSEEVKRGAKGGNARAAKLTKEQRSDIAKKAAAKRWGKKGKEDAIDALMKADTEWINDQLGKIHTEVNLTASELTQEITIEHPEHCPACAMGQSLEKGEGTHVLLTVEHPIDPYRIQSLPAPPQPTQTQRKRSTKPMPKAFKGASSYAEKRLAEALKERAEYMGRVAALNAEIPSLVQVIRALGTSNIPPEALQSYPPTIPSYGTLVQNSYPADLMQNIPNTIDPALYATNNTPLPGITSPIAQVPPPPNTSAGGAIDLDFKPQEDEGPPLPRMGGGWV